MSKEVNTSLLSSLVKNKRGKKGLRDTAIDIGDISASTLSRIEQGKLPDLDTFFKICKWLGKNSDIFMENKKSTRNTSDVKDKISVHLRSDSTLSSETADALIKMIELAYKSEINK